MGRFSKRGDGLSTICNDCQAIYYKAYYQRNKKREIARAKKNVKKHHLRMKDLTDKIKSKPCLDCGVEHPPWIMDFDHREGTNKLGAVGNLVRHASETRILEEIKKCDVVCSNCHRQRTHDRRERRRSAIGSATDL